MIIRLLHSFIKFRSISIKAYFVNISSGDDHLLMPKSFAPTQAPKTEILPTEKSMLEILLAFLTETLLEETLLASLASVK